VTAHKRQRAALLGTEVRRHHRRTRGRPSGVMACRGAGVARGAASAVGLAGGVPSAAFERPAARGRDLDANDVNCLAAVLHALGYHCCREPFAVEAGEHLGLEPVRQHDRCGDAVSPGVGEPSRRVRPGWT
jgi:hypothetical protein